MARDARPPSSSSGPARNADRERPRGERVPDAEDAAAQARRARSPGSAAARRRAAAVAEPAARNATTAAATDGASPLAAKPSAIRRAPGQVAPLQRGSCAAPRAAQRPGDEAEPVDRSRGRRSRRRSPSSSSRASSGWPTLKIAPNRRAAPDATSTTRSPAIPAVATQARRAPRASSDGRAASASSRAGPRRSAGGRAGPPRRAKVTALTARIVSGPPTSSTAAAARGPGDEAEVGDRPVQRRSRPAAAASSTRLGSAASAAGVNSPVPIPASRASTNVGDEAVDEHDARRRRRARITSAATTQVRRDQRSAAAPNTGPSSIAGTTSASSTEPIAHGESKRSSATSRSATYAAPVPSADCASAAKKTRPAARAAGGR